MAGHRGARTGFSRCPAKWLDAGAHGGNTGAGRWFTHDPAAHPPLRPPIQGAALSDRPSGRIRGKGTGLIRYGESPNLEFKSTLRTNLKTGKAGKEIELAWLKSVVGFLNTDGGVLLIGVNDGGEVVSIAADQFENDDKCLCTSRT